MVVHVRLKKTRLRDVDHDESIGMAKREARGRVNGARSADSDMFLRRRAVGFGVGAV